MGMNETHVQNENGTINQRINTSLLQVSADETEESERENDGRERASEKWALDRTTKRSRHK